MQKNKNLILFAIFFIIYEFNTYIANDMIMPGMIQVVNEFHSSVENIATSLSLYIIGGSTLQIFLGPLCEKYGKKKILLAGNILFLITSAIIPFTSNITQFLWARYFQGMGLCFIFIGYAMIHDLFDDKTAVKLTTLVANISVFAPLIGPIFGSAVIVALDWRYIFAITAVLAITSLIGLNYSMPDTKLSENKMNISDILKTYSGIFKTKILVMGGLIIGIVSLPMLSWIGLAPVLVMKVMGKGYSTYIIYQALVFGGFILSSILIQYIAGKFSFFTLITRGTAIAFTGLLISFIFHKSEETFIAGMFLSSFGIGIFTGSIFRVAITSTGLSNSMSAASLNIIQSATLAACLEIFNLISNKLNYSILSFTLINLIVGIIMLAMCFKFANMIKNRNWQ